MDVINARRWTQVRPRLRRARLRLQRTPVPSATTRRNGARVRIARTLRLPAIMTSGRRARPHGNELAGKVSE